MKLSILRLTLFLLSVNLNMSGVATIANAMVATKKNRTAQKPTLFPVGAKLHRQVWFWEQIFREYTSHDAVIHDTRNPELIVDVVNIQKLRPEFVQNEPENLVEQERQNLSDSWLDRYKLALERFSTAGEGAVVLGSIERRIWNVYKDHPEGRRRLLAGEVVLRSQRGLADKFVEATAKAQKYFPYFEAIFKKEGLPPELTRMVFVESMFQLDAWSKVGASGLWQFMPATGRRFGLRVSATIDERNSPLKATRAAALFLKSNYQKLNHWPLAITSYNHGANGIARAVKEAGTSNLEEIIENYSSSSFGFASRNFYAEFIAAKNVYQQLSRKHPSVRGRNLKDPLGISLLEVPKGIALSQVIRFSPLNESLVKRLNPCLLSQAWNRKFKFTPLPEGYHIVVPTGMLRKVSSSLKRVRI